MPDPQRWKNDAYFGSGVDTDRLSGLELDQALAQQLTLFSPSPEQGPSDGLSFKRQLLFKPATLALNAGLAIQHPYIEQHSSAIGLSFSLGGRIAVNDALSFYGRSTWLPKLYDFSTPGETPELEFSTGIVLSPLPNFSIQAGYRRFSLDHSQKSREVSRRSIQGLFLGTGLYW